MNDRVGELETRVGDLEGTIGDLKGLVKNLNKALSTEITSRVNADQEEETQLFLLADLLSDDHKTRSYTNKYQDALTAEYTAKETVLQGSMRDFSNLMKLPPKSNKYAAIWDAAWVITAAVVPALRLLPAVQKLEKAAALEGTLAKVFKESPTLATRIATAAAKGHNVADVVAKINNSRDKSNKAADVKTSVPLDKSASAIKDLIKESNAAHLALDHVIDVFDVEFDARIHSLLYKVPYQAKGTLLAMANRLLPPLDYFDDTQIEQLGRLYLWKIIGEYAKQNVFIVTTRYRTGDTVSIDGFNDSQRDQIMEWFGPQSSWQGGTLPPIANIWVALSIWNVQSRTESSGGSIFGFG
jgi:hypothetical protein